MGTPSEAVSGLGWLGVRTDAFEATVAVYRDFRGPDGNVYEIIGPDRAR